MGPSTLSILLQPHLRPLQLLWLAATQKFPHGIHLLYLQLRTQHHILPPHRSRQLAIWLVCHHCPGPLRLQTRWPSGPLGLETRHRVSSRLHRTHSLSSPQPLKYAGQERRAPIFVYSIHGRRPISMGGPRVSEGGGLLGESFSRGAEGGAERNKGKMGHGPWTFLYCR